MTVISQIHLLAFYLSHGLSDAFVDRSSVTSYYLRLLSLYPQRSILLLHVTMASRVKKLFRRKKDDSLTEQESPPRDLPRRAQRSTGGTNNSSLRHSLYEDTAPGMYPQTGDYPLRGADGSQYDLPRGKNHGRQNASTSDLTYSQPTAKSRESHERPSTSRQPRDPSLSREFAGLNFDEGQRRCFSAYANLFGANSRDTIDLQDSSRVANKPLRHLLPGNLPPGQYVEDVADRNAGNIRHSGRQVIESQSYFQALIKIRWRQREFSICCCTAKETCSLFVG